MQHAADQHGLPSTAEGQQTWQSVPKTQRFEIVVENGIGDRKLSYSGVVDEMRDTSYKNQVLGGSRGQKSTMFKAGAGAMMSPTGKHQL